MLAKLGVNRKLFNQIQKVQGEALQTINFLPNTALVREIYKISESLKLFDFISLKNALLVKNCFEKQLPQTLMNFLKKAAEQHNHLTCAVTKKCGG